jgi:hypothetical protein
MIRQRNDRPRPDHRPRLERHMTPQFAGAPDGIRLSDRLLIEWVANASPGDAFPEPWSNAHSPLQSMIRHLVELGVLPPPARDAPVATIARDATAAAKVWLEHHPPPAPQPDPTPRGASRGRSWGR